MTEITVVTTAMGFRVPLTSKGTIDGTSVHIGRFASKFEQWEYNKQTRRSELVEEFFYFDKVNQKVHFPRYALDEFKIFLGMHGVQLRTLEDFGVVGTPVEFLMLPHIEYKNDKQRNAVAYLTNEESGPLRGLALQTGAGKSSDVDALIRKPNGWVRMGDIKLGEELSMPDGTSAPVIGIYPQGKLDLYRVTFEDGRWTDVSLDHLWEVNYVQWKDKWRIITTEQIMEYLKQPTYRARMGVRLISAPESKDIDLPIDPYFLGAYLGDGSIVNNAVSICKPDDWLRKEIDRLLPPGISATPYMKDDKTFYIRGRDNCSNRRMCDILEDLQLRGNISHTKFIPQIYMEASTNQKWSLLQGLMDTDGTVGLSEGRGGTEKVEGKGSNIQYCTTSLDLAKQVQLLIRSLGGLCKIKSKKPFFTYKGERREGKEAYILHIRVKDPKKLFRLPRKKDRVTDNYQYADRLKLRIRSVEYVKTGAAQCIMVDHPDHLYIADNYVVTHNTVSHIWSLQKLGVLSMTMMTSRLEQWAKEIVAYTTLEAEDIYIIQGVGSLTKLFDQIGTKLFPKLILASTATVRLYLEYGSGYSHLPHPTEFCDKTGIGLIGFDEYHEHFNTNLLAMLAFNPKVFIPITATFAANSPFVKSIFDSVIPKEVQFEGGAYDRFVSVFAYQYNNGAHFIRPTHYMRAKGYSQNKFEEWLLTKKGELVLKPLLHDAIIPIITEHYINIAEKGEKFLMICSSKEMCDYLVGVFKRTFKGKTVSAFYFGMPTTVLERYDMILSTPGSAGTGRDIKGLRTCFAFENTGSTTRNLQFIGRLRGPPQMLNEPRFIYLNFACIPQHLAYHSSRSMLYGPRALKFTHRRIG